MYKKWCGYFLFGIFIFCLDRVSKIAALTHCYQFCYIINQFVSFQVYFNRGVAWSLFNSDDTMTFILVSFIQFLITGFVCLYAYRRYSEGFTVFAELLIIVGSLSNIVDRIVYSGVIDFIILSCNGFVWPVFNVADIAIVSGVMMMMLLQHEK